MPKGIYPRTPRGVGPAPGAAEAAGEASTSPGDTTARAEHLLDKAEGLMTKMNDFERLIDALVGLMAKGGIRYGQDFESTIPLKGGLICTLKLHWAKHLRRAHFDQIRRWIDLLEESMASEDEDEDEDGPREAGETKEEPAP